MKVLIIGVAIAAAAGAAAGGAMQPVLAQAPHPMEAAAWGAGDAEEAGPAGAWSASAHVPDYVVGTDWLARTAPPGQMADVVWPEIAPPETPSPPTSYATAYEDEPAPPSAYPSERGDILAGVHDAASPDEVAPEPPSA